jgi:hypothetical protein
MTSTSPKVIARIKGGLGNQLFCYAAARRLAVVNKAELVIDDVTGFSRDRLYRRRYSLNVFDIPVRKATLAERMEPLERARRGIAKLIASRQPFDKRRYIVQEGYDFDERLLRIRLDRAVYLDGLWQGEGYFKDIEETIRRDLTFKAPTDDANRAMAARMQSPSAVSIHVRWFDVEPGQGVNNVATRYYRSAIARMEALAPRGEYFVFSDFPERVGEVLGLPENRYVVVAHNKGEANAYADMWLMTKATRHITANSTFSWWGAWLSPFQGKVVICPGSDSIQANWNFKGLVPDAWVRL